MWELRSFKAIASHFTTRADCGHAIPEKFIKISLVLVRFHADRQIKPHAPPTRYIKPPIILNFKLALVVFRWTI